MAVEMTVNVEGINIRVDVSCTEHVRQLTKLSNFPLGTGSVSNFLHFKAEPRGKSDIDIITIISTHVRRYIDCRKIRSPVLHLAMVIAGSTMIFKVFIQLNALGLFLADVQSMIARRKGVHRIRIFLCGKHSKFYMSLNGQCAERERVFHKTVTEAIALLYLWRASCRKKTVIVVSLWTLALFCMMRKYYKIIFATTKNRVHGGM